MTVEWRSWAEADWRDSGKSIEAQYDDGRTIVGKLIASDFVLLDDGDEAPIFEIELADGTSISFYEFERWREVAPARGEG